MINKNESENGVIVSSRPSIPLYSRPLNGTTSWAKHLTKADNEDVLASNQGVDEGRKEHPFNMEGTAKFITASAHHSACISAKVAASVGLGLEDESAEEKLDDLCDVSFQQLINEVSEDFENTGNGYIEVVRRDGEIRGLHHIHAPGVWVNLDDPLTMDFHYEIQSKEGFERRFARFGDGDRIARKFAGIGAVGEGGSVSEVIHIKEPTSLSRWYGVPRWLSAVAAVELVMSILQHNYDYFNNRGVPEFILFVLGKKVNDEDWRQIEQKIQEHVGLGNGHKSMAVNFAQPDIQVQLEKLGSEVSEEGAFESMLDALSMMIVSAHQVPPQLAGIMIPGKLGATNELPNAMATFQALVISQKQKLWRSVLGCTLGKDGMGVEGLSRDSFKFITIMDEINLPAMEATARTRRPAAEGIAEDGSGPQGGNRAPEAGTPAARLSEMTKDLTPEERGKAIAVGIAKTIDHLIGAA